MSWATHHIMQLSSGTTAQFRPRGDSMKGKIKAGNRAVLYLSVDLA
jgi:hypothetical protein